MESVNLWKLYILALIAVPTVAQFEFNPYELFGCIDKASDKLVTVNRGVFSGPLTLQKCRDSCARTSATYFGISEGDTCRCFLSAILRTTTSVPPLTLSCYGENAKRCEGDENQYCGADDAYLIYSVCPPGSYGENCDQACRCAYCQNLCRFGASCDARLRYPGYQYVRGQSCEVCGTDK